MMPLTLASVDQSLVSHPKDINSLHNVDARVRFRRGEILDSIAAGLEASLLKSLS
jgi:hypothetical protein